VLVLDLERQVAVIPGSQLSTKVPSRCRIGADWVARSRFSAPEALPRGK
jgi:hypothetical protein